MQNLQPNTTLQDGKYRIERVLGQGGFGITYLATQLSLQRQVAIKEFFMKDFCCRDERTYTISTPSTGSYRLAEQYRKKFIKEARNLARLSHPNIINVIDVFEENDTVYYVMPYLSGGSLLDYVRRHGALSEQEAMKYVKQIASALKYMHEEQHICHYDVKPANILLDDKGNAVLIDFGISKNYDSNGYETTTTPIGLSEGYAPIEQYQQNVEEFSPVSDVYALGATLYFLLHGRTPVPAVNRASGMALLMRKNLSSDIKQVINASLKLSKRERSQSVDIFMNNISVSSNEKKNPVLAVLGGSAVVLMFFFICIVLPIIVYLGGGWIADSIYHFFKPINDTMTLREIYNQELFIHGMVAYAYLGVGEMIRDSDNDYIYIGGILALFGLVLLFCYVFPMSEGYALIYSAIWIISMGLYGYKSLVD